MRARLFIVAAALGVVAVELSRESGRAVAPAPRGPEKQALRAAALRDAPASTLAVFTRDPFRFADEGPVVHESRAQTERAASPSAELAPPRVRLVGFVRRGGLLRATLVLDGEVVLVSAGDTVGGHRVLSLEEQVSVHLRDPEGVETTLALPEEP